MEALHSGQHQNQKYKNKNQHFAELTATSAADRQKINSKVYKNRKGSTNVKRKRSSKTNRSRFRFSGLKSALALCRA